jgi:multidrug efflux pump subunit AcrA (membrane-fusion protein)
MLAGWLSSFKQEAANEPVPEIVKSVKTAPVIYGDVKTKIMGYGRVLAAETIDLVAEKSGLILRNNGRLKEGRDFRTGEIIFRIDDTEQQLSLQSQKSNFLRDLASVLPDIRIDFPESYDKWNQYFNAIVLDEPLPELPEYASEKEKTFMATKNIFSGYYDIKGTETALGKYIVYAPFNGTITEVFQQEGSVVNPGTRVATYIRTDKKELRIAVDVQNIEWIDKGTPAIIYDETENHQWTGRVSRMGDYLNPNTQSLDVFIEINPGRRKLYDGQYLKAQMEGAMVRNAAVIPREAVFNKNQVYVLNDSVLNVEEIEVARTDPSTVIYRGLKGGTEVVVEPLLNAFNNMKAQKLGEEQTTDSASNESNIVQTSN